MLPLNKRIFVCSWLSLGYSLAKDIVITDTSLRKFSVFVSVAAEHFTKSEGINQ
jgi:hypothetical protein